VLSQAETQRATSALDTAADWGSEATS
jgi:hypothetical protein